MKLTKEQALENLYNIIKFGGLMMSAEYVESVRMATEAYEQEPGKDMGRYDPYTDSFVNEDCISRQAVDKLSKELVHTTRDKADFLCNFWEGLQKLPPVQSKPKAGLVPVSESLPKAGEYVGNIPKYYLVQNEFGDMLVARYTHSEYWEQIYQHKPIANEIVAWCELPERYGSESEDK